MKVTISQFVAGVVLMAALTLPSPSIAFTAKQALDSYQLGGQAKQTIQVFILGWMRGLNAFCSIDVFPWASIEDFIDGFFSHLDQKQGGGEDWNPEKPLSEELLIFISVEVMLTGGHIDCDR
jgi:hypothetical protein